ncbi:MAG TPA: hypothetical protein VKY89_23945 [Thermoanaerobaculia bacterium]|nr:hypothetical protein [Thermoanaerobaculia bacterium]
MSEPVSLLEKARQCYLAAGWLVDACRLSENLGDHARAAQLNERLGRVEAAAEAYARAGLWRDAARCFESCGRPREAAECLVESGEFLAASWLLADRAHRFAHAREVAARLEPASPAEALLRDLVVARCEQGGGEPAAAARRLRQAAAGLGRIEGVQERLRAEQWALAVGQSLRRPDLVAMVYAAAYTAGNPGAEERWEIWARDALGDASGVPRRAER